MYREGVVYIRERERFRKMKNCDFLIKVYESNAGVIKFSVFEWSKSYGISTFIRKYSWNIFNLSNGWYRKLVSLSKRFLHFEMLEKILDFNVMIINLVYFYIV